MAAAEGDDRPVVTRGFRAISNQIEEDAVNGLLKDLLRPISQKDLSPPQPPVSEGEGVSDSGDESDEMFFADVPPESPKKKEPPVKLLTQPSELSWIDYLRQECPVCAEGNGVACGPCGNRVCGSCVRVFRRNDETLLVRVCRRCRPLVPVDGLEVCPACCVGDLSIECSECRRQLCGACVSSYLLQSLGESEARSICSSCVEAVQRQLATLRENSDSPKSNLSGAPPSPRREGSFWRLRSPRRSESDLKNAPRGPGASIQKSKSVSLLKRSTAVVSDPFPGVRLHESAEAMPETLARRGSRPAMLEARKNHEGNDEIDEIEEVEEFDERLARAADEFQGDEEKGELTVRRGDELRVVKTKNVNNGGEGEGDPLANAAACAGHHCDLAVQNAHFDPFAFSAVRLGPASRLLQGCILLSDILSPGRLSCACCL